MFCHCNKGGRFLCLVHYHNNTQVCQFEKMRGKIQLVFIKHLLNDIVGSKCSVPVCDSVC